MHLSISVSKVKLVKAGHSAAIASSPSFTVIFTHEHCDIISRNLATSVSANAHQLNISSGTPLNYSFEEEVKC